MTDHPHFSGIPHFVPSTEEDRVSWLRLIRSHRVGVMTFFRLLDEYGSATAALSHLPDVAAKAGVSDYRPATDQAIHTEIQAAKSCGAQMLCFSDPQYPPLLREIADPPPVIWLRGNPEHLTKPCLSLVGARNASSLGARMARKLAQDLGQAGFIITSGLARGIDTAAHQASLETGSIAVFGGGVDVIYPKENAGLAQDILENGCIISEAPMGQYPQARHFPSRNRIVAGLSRATLVIEAAARSGSLITARAALDQSRDVLAVPGHPFDARASGCNMLLRDGATLIRSAEDVLDVVGAAYPPVPDPVEETAPPPAQSAEVDTAELHQEILSRLGPSPLAEDQLIRDLSMPPPLITPALVCLEMAGEITRHPGGLLSLP